MIKKITTSDINGVNVKSTSGSRLIGTVQENKHVFDKLPELIASAINEIVDALLASADGDSGADNIHITPITGIAGTTVQSILESIKAALDDTYNQEYVNGKLDEKADKTTVAQSIKEVSLNSDNGVLTFTRQDGTAYAIDTMLEKIVTNFAYDGTTQSLVFTASDGTVNRVSVAEFITNNEFVDSAQIDFSVTGGIVTATIKDACITDNMLASALRTALEGYKDAAGVSAANAAASEANVRSYASNASASANTATQKASDAATKASEAAASAVSASTSASTATTKAKEASDSAKSALSSATTATTKASEASSSASSASDSAILSGQKSTAAHASAVKSESYAVGGTSSRTGEDADNAKYYKEQALLHKQASETAKQAAETARTEAENLASDSSSSATNAAASAVTARQKSDEASAQAKKSESYAIGGTGTRTGEDTDNAKYYKEQSGIAKDGAVTAKNASETAKSNAETAAASALTSKNESQKNADTAKLEATEAAASATDAASSAATATTKASEAATSASNASESAKTATTKATEASASASDALTAKIAAEQARDEARDIAGGDYATNTALTTHTANTDIHITAQKKESWDNKVDAVPGKGLSSNDYTDAEKNKLSRIAEEANKYTHPSYTAKASDLYKVTVDGAGHVSAATKVVKKDITDLGVPAQDTVYTHPSYTPKASGLYKVTVDDKGHVSATAAVAKADITALGIPAQDTVYTHPTNHPATIITQDVSHRMVSDTQISTWDGKSDFSGAYADLTGKPTIPTKTSELTNDSGYVTESELSGRVPVANGGTPAVSTADNDKVLKVVNGEWAVAESSGGVSIGTTAPTNTKLLWVDLTPQTGGLKYYNGTIWVGVPVQFT